MASHSENRQSGFSALELVLTIGLLAILSAVAILSFIDFQEEAKEATAQSLLSAIRSAVQNQQAQMLLRCGAPVNSWPAAADIQANDITNGNSYCTAAHIPNPSERKFLVGYDNGLPVNPLGDPPTNIVIDCQAFSNCPASMAFWDKRSRALIFEPNLFVSNPFDLQSRVLNTVLQLFNLPQALGADLPVTLGAPCMGGAEQNYSNGWCYNSASGGIYADAELPKEKKKKQSSSISPVVAPSTNNNSGSDSPSASPPPPADSSYDESPSENPPLLDSSDDSPIDDDEPYDVNETPVEQTPPPPPPTTTPPTEETPPPPPPTTTPPKAKKEGKKK